MFQFSHMSIMGLRRPLVRIIILGCLVITSLLVLSFQGHGVKAATVCSAKSYGATGNGTTKDTAALQKAINACAGGGTVELTSGKYLSGSLTLPGNITFQIDSGATLLASQSASDYPANGSDLQALLLAHGSNVTITGGGTIDGQGAPWWSEIDAEKAAGQTLSPRPPLIDLESVTTATISNITLKNAPNMHITMKKSSEVTITGITISSPSNSPNTDGIDVWASSYVSVTNSTIDDGDDDIAIDSSPSDGPAHDISLSSCTILHGHGLSIGSYTGGGVYNVNIHNDTLTNTEIGVRIKSARGRGGEVHNITYTHLTMTNVQMPIQITAYYPSIPAESDPPQPVTSTTPNYHDITISKITATGATSAGEIIGVPEQPIVNLTLSSVNITATTGLTVRNATVTATSTTISVSSGSAYILQTGGVVNT
ncbi:MAG TPA: glycosyl hydrolase family 28 protein [Ktedonobacteraceae bacterium]|nr:glycosyl hydrolase family 28 protein [Ktedonobacteraceae bacterium]